MILFLVVIALIMSELRRQSYSWICIPNEAIGHVKHPSKCGKYRHCKESGLPRPFGVKRMLH